ncbi:MAG: trypsin-like peptidase domain-containing protein [Rubripirellula sp.]
MKRIPLNLCRSVVGLSLLVVASSAHGQFERRDNQEMINLVRPVAKAVKNAVVQVYSGDKPVALGTVVAADGYVLTKRSELSGDPIRVRLSDNRLLPARVAAVRRGNDLALLKIQADITVRPAEFSGEPPPVASFVVSVGRKSTPIGVGVFGAAPRPVDHRGRLGVLLEDDSSGRALVQGVWPDSGAEMAGIKEGDLIVAINGREEKSRLGVIETLRGMFPGESVRLTIRRKNSSRGLSTMEMDASIRDFGVMQESESDTKVNGPRNVRLSGFDQVMQHDTVLDPDECGGPLLDTKGNVIGINIARAGRVVTYALPSSLILPEMISMLAEARGSTR